MNFDLRKLRKARSTKTLAHLAVALLCVNVVFLSGIDKTPDKTGNLIGCMVVAALLHYFVLAAFMWMLVQAVVQYLKFVKVLGTHINHFMWKASAAAWGK